MAQEQEKLFYFERNVRYTIGVRRFTGDRDGVVLNSQRPYLAVKESELRDFRFANQTAIKAGVIREIPEPALPVESLNALTDTDIGGLLSSYAKLKSTLQTLDSLPILYKIRDAAIEKDVSKRTMSLITARITEVEPEEEVISREDMKGSN